MQLCELPRQSCCMMRLDACNAACMEKGGESLVME